MKNKNVSLLLVMTVALSVVISGCGKKEETTPQEKQVAVEVQTVSNRNIEVKTVLSGKILPAEEASVSPKISGQIENIYVEIGDYVKKGDVLFTIDSQNYQAQFNQAQASYFSAESSYSAASARMENAKLNLDRNRELYEAGAISKQQYENMQLQALDSELESARYGVESARASMENAKIALANAVVRAPISGKIAVVNVQTGDMASPGMNAVTITDASRVEIETSVSENLINKISKGESVEIRVESASPKPIKGKISALAQSTTSDTMTYPIKIEIDNKDGVIKPGMFAEVDVVTESQKGVVAVPSEALVVKDGTAKVFVVENGVAISKEVETGIDDGQYVKVEKGISQGEQVVVKGQNYIDENSKVNINGQEAK